VDWVGIEWENTYEKGNVIIKGDNRWVNVIILEEWTDVKRHNREINKWQ
jgi:hypothetical protein